MFNRIEWLRHQRSNICPNCNGSKSFVKCLVKSTYYCPKCKEIWRYVCVGFQHKYPHPIWFYENKELNENRIKISIK